MLRDSHQRVTILPHQHNRLSLRTAVAGKGEACARNPLKEISRATGIDIPGDLLHVCSSPSPARAYIPNRLRRPALDKRRYHASLPMGSQSRGAVSQSPHKATRVSSHFTPSAVRSSITSLRNSWELGVGRIGAKSWKRRAWKRDGVQTFFQIHAQSICRIERNERDRPPACS